MISNNRHLIGHVMDLLDIFRHMKDHLRSVGCYTSHKNSRGDALLCSAHVGLIKEIRLKVDIELSPEFKPCLVKYIHSDNYQCIK